MTIAKKVAFLERVNKSKLGLDGLQKVVYSDRARHNEKNIENNVYNFAKIGKKMLKEIDGEYVKNKYNNLNSGKEFGSKLHEERVKWLREYYENNCKN